MGQHSAWRSHVTTASTEMILLSDPSLPAVSAEFRHYCDDPFAVQMLLSVDQSPPVSWVFGRELLITGKSAPSGIGDVQVYPTYDGVIIELRSGSIVAILLAHTPDISDFVDQTVYSVPLGSEFDHYDLDLELASLPVHDTFEA